MIGVGADEHPPALVVENHFVEIDILRTAKGAGFIETLDIEGIVLEIQADDVGIGRNRIDALLAAGAEELQRLRHEPLQQP